MCVFNMCFSSCETSKLRHILRSGLYPKQVIARSSRLRLIFELKTRTGCIYHEVNGNPEIETSGRRQWAKRNAFYTAITRAKNPML